VDITQFPEHKRARLIGRVFQNPFTGTAPDMSIAENLALAAKRGMHRGLGQALNKKSIEAFREQLRLLKRGWKTASTIPSGSFPGAATSHHPADGFPG
jgi:putative ABC transport system ATP-binding protein